MCDVAPRPGHSRQCRGGDDGDTVAVTDNSILPGGRTAQPGHAQPRPDQEHRGRGEEYSSTWSDRIQVYADAKKYDVLRRIHNAIIVEIRSIL